MPADPPELTAKIPALDTETPRRSVELPGAGQGGISSMPRFTVTQTLEERFWAKVDKRGPDECWPWVGSASSTNPWREDFLGYGRFWANGERRPATQVSWEIAHGEPFPKGKLACHTCDNTICVNPSHLFVGDHRTNALDARSKGHMGERGVEGLGARIAEARRQKGYSQNALAGRVGRSPIAIGRWEKGEREPSLSDLIDLTQILGVTADELLGIPDG